MNESEQATSTAPLKTRTPRLSAEKSLPQSSAETLVRIIKGYAIASSGGQVAINYKDVASVSGIPPTVVSGNNKFLLESQILISPKFGYYVPSEGAVRFAREAAWDEPAAKTHLRRIIVSTWYGQIAAQNLMLRPSLRRDELKRALAIKAGATEGDSNALDFVIGFLIYAGVVAESETGTLARGEIEPDETVSAPDADIAVRGVESPAGIGPVSAIAPARAKPIALTVHIHINSPEDLTEEYATRVRDWLEFVRDQNTEVSIDARER